MKPRIRFTAIALGLCTLTFAGGDPAAGQGLSAQQGAAPEPTRAEQELQREQEFHARLSAVTGAIDTLTSTLMAMRRSIAPASDAEVERFERELAAAEQELAQLALAKVSQLAQFQRDEQVRRLEDLRFMLKAVKERWKSSLPLFGRKAFQTPSPEAPLKAAPKGYRLRVGDRILVNVASRIGAGRDYPLTVDRSGKISLAGAGKLEAAGKTLAQLQAELQKRIGGRFSQLTVTASLESFAQKQVQVMGEVERPGAVLLGADATLSDALRAAGGPTDSASLRRVRVTSAAGSKKTIDLYQLLVKGQRQADVPLGDGDLVFVPTIGSSIVVAGEVVRPARYEILSALSLPEAVALAGGPKPGAATRNVTVQRTDSGEYRELFNEPLQAGAKFTVQPGDEILVGPVGKDEANRVSIVGPVRNEGIYAFKKGMRVKDLIERAQGFLPEAEVYKGRADILRYDPLAGARLVTVNLGRALEGDPANNVELHRYDRLFVYTPDQVAFQPRVVRLVGALAKPGVYRRTPGMRVSDAVAAAGGTLPEAFLSRANLLRRIADDKTELIAVDLAAALSGDPEANLPLADRDELTVFTYDEVRFSDPVVKVEGFVQRPGVLRRSENMRLSDALFTAGGLLPEADPRVEVARVKPDGSVAAATVDARSLAPKSAEDVLLRDNDVITVRSLGGYERGPSVVFLSGEVAKPGPYAIDPKKDRLADLIARAGGLTELAQPDGALFLRKKEMFTNQVQNDEADALLERNKLLADRQFLVQLAKLGGSAGAATTAGSAAKPIDKTPEQLLEETKKVLAEEAKTPADQKKTPQTAFGEPLEQPEKTNEQKLKTLEDLIRVSINLEAALKSSGVADNLLLADGDRIHIPRKTGLVTIVGAVLHPHRLAASEKGTFASYIAKAGGYAPDAAPAYAIVIRANGDAFPARKVKHVVPGDMIVVPTTGLVDITRKLERVQDVTKILADVLSSVFILTKL